jgi:tetratricopeptide (TPR) repeat protein
MTARCSALSDFRPLRFPWLRATRGVLLAAALVTGWVPGLAVGAEGSSVSLFGPAEPHYERGAHFLRMEDVPAARAELAEAAEWAPNSPKVLRLYAEVLVLSGQPARAQAILSRLAEIEPLGADFEYSLALASFRVGDWESARDRLRVMASRAPEPGSAYLYLGVAHQELGALEAAESAFSQALGVNPSLLGAVAYRRGIIALQRRRYSEAVAEFEIVVERLPGTPLALSAGEYLEQLEVLEPDPWEVFVRAGMGYDSNINLASDDDSFTSSGEKGWRGIGAAGGSYAFGDDELGLQVGQTLYGHFYTADGQFDQQSSLTWAWGHVELTDSLEVDLRYGFEYAWADWKDYRSSQNIEPGLTWEISSRLAARVSLRVEDRTYYFTPPTPAFDRTGTVDYAGTDVFLALPPLMASAKPQASNWLRFGYRYRNEDSRGDQFLSSGNQPLFTLALALPWQVQSILDARVEWRDYAVPSLREPAAGPRRDTIAIVRGGFERPLGDRASLEISYRYSNRNSNVNYFDYQRHEISFLGTYRY